MQPPDENVIKKGYPCQLCHFCVKVDKDHNGSQCVWYDVHIIQTYVTANDAPLRQICVSDPKGDRFMWRLPNVPALDYAKWRRDILQTKGSRVKTHLALILSALALLVSLVSTLLTKGLPWIT